MSSTLSAKAFQIASACAASVSGALRALFLSAAVQEALKRIALRSLEQLVLSTRNRLDDELLAAVKKALA